MSKKQPLTVEDFSKLWATMRLNHEKFFAEKRANWQADLDRLGDYLDRHPE